MLESYSINTEVGANSFIPFNNVSIKKGCTVTKSSADTIDLNKCGVYMVSVDASAGTSTTIQLYKDGVAQPQAQSTGINPSFVTLVQVPKSNCDCPCSSPTTIQVMNTTATTFDDINLVVTKVI
jgi:hypothetical protein